MKLVILEPLGVEKEKLLSMAQKTTNGTLEIEYYSTRAEDPDTLIERSKDADVVVLTNFQYRKNIIEHCPKLKMICVAFTGVDHVDTAYCQERGITVCNCAGYSTVAVSELVFGMLIDLYRHIIDCNQAVRSGGTINGMTGIEIQGKTFGVIGTGAIGLRVAAIAQALGCNILAYS
ncbi:MAG TPA: hydroxyacid dehydrogenase, partial [Ruminococcaceae bacterium]|nr:hydroxyacid dehydrogenase [Oscillospiraceae bacterium]